MIDEQLRDALLLTFRLRLLLALTRELAEAGKRGYPAEIKAPVFNFMAELVPVTTGNAFIEVVDLAKRRLCALGYAGEFTVEALGEAMEAGGMFKEEGGTDE